jgi:hypothetical protein
MVRGNSESMGSGLSSGFYDLADRHFELRRAGPSFPVMLVDILLIDGVHKLAVRRDTVGDVHLKLA